MALLISSVVMLRRYRRSEAPPEGTAVAAGDARAARRDETAQIPVPVPSADRARRCHIPGRYIALTVIIL